MDIGDIVIYDDRKAKIVKAKWGLYCIEFIDTHNQIWVTPDVLKRQDF